MRHANTYIAGLGLELGAEMTGVGAAVIHISSRNHAFGVV